MHEQYIKKHAKALKRKICLNLIKQNKKNKQLNNQTSKAQSNQTSPQWSRHLVVTCTVLHDRVASKNWRGFGFNHKVIIIRSMKGQIRILTWEVHLSSFTATVIILNPTVGSGWNFMWSLLTWFPTLGYNFRPIGVRKGIETRVNRGCMNFVIYFILTCGLPIWLGFFS